MDFEIPTDIAAFLEEVDQFIEDKIKPLEQMDDNIRFFDHRREDARTDWERQGLLNEEWESLLRKAKEMAIEADIQLPVSSRIRRPRGRQPRDGHYQGAPGGKRSGAAQ